MNDENTKSDILKLQQEVYRLKKRLKFWSTIVYIIVIDISITIGLTLLFLGIKDMNDVNADFLFIRLGGCFLSITSIITMVLTNIYLLVKD